MEIPFSGRTFARLADARCPDCLHTKLQAAVGRTASGRRLVAASQKFTCGYCGAAFNLTYYQGKLIFAERTGQERSANDNKRAAVPQEPAPILCFVNLI